MASSPTTDQHKLEMLRIRCKELGITAEQEETLAFLGSASIPHGIIVAMNYIELAEIKLAELKKVDLVASSMESTYGKTIDNFKQPPIELNMMVKPSVGHNTRRYKIKNRKGITKVVKMKIPEVNIEQDCKEMWVNVNDVKIPVETSDTRRWHSSILGAALTPPDKLMYSNEFMVQLYCEHMIRDALKALGLLNEVDSHLEFSMYLMKPDIVLVVKYQGRVFFAAEVKSPEVGVEKVFGNNAVAGQIWSYLYAMKASGNQCPIGAIMTYNKISIVTLRDYTKNEQGKDDAAHKTRIEMAKQCLSTGYSPVRVQDEKTNVNCELRNDSPIKERKDFSNTNREDNAEFQRELREEVVEKNAFCSPVHEDREVFPCLLQAIEIAYRVICDADAEEHVYIENNTPIGGRLVFKLGENSFDWVKISGSVCANNGKIPNKNTEYLYNLGKLGDGGSASVYLACSTGGNMCALKDYFLEKSSAAYDKARDIEENEDRQKLIRKAEDEESRWTELYGGRRGRIARAQCFGGKHCLLMPYGHQVATEPGDRWQHVPGIRKELEYFAQSSKGTKGAKRAKGRPGYKYKDSDLRWRHALLDTKNKIFLCDLESLEKIDDTENPNELVYKQLDILLRPMRNKEEEQKTHDWLLHSTTSIVVSLICSIGTLKDFFEGLKDFFEGSSQDGDMEVTELYGKILESLFPSTVRFEDLSANPKAVVTLCMISHYRNGQLDKQQCEASQSNPSIPGLQESQSIEEVLGNGKNPEDASKL